MPSGCHLVKINVSKRLLDRLTFDSLSVSSSTRKRASLLSTPTNEYDMIESEFDEFGEDYPRPNSRAANNNDEDDLVMDILPETTRFTTLVSINKINVDLLDDDHLNINDDYDDQDESEPMQQLIMYVQKNSRLKLVLLSLDSVSREHYQDDNLIRNVIKKFTLHIFISFKE